MRIECTVSTEDLAEWLVYHNKNRIKAINRITPIKYLYILIYIFIMGSILYTLVSILDIKSNSILLPLIIVSIIGLLSIITNQYKPKSKESYIKALKNEDLTHITGKISYTIKEGMLIVEDEFSKTEFSYKGIYDIIDSENYLYIYISKRMAYIIPKSNQSSAVDTFYKLIKDKVSSRD